VAGSFIDGSGDPVRRNVFLEVKDGIITDIGPAAKIPGNGGVIVDDLKHCTIVPPFVDCSVSLARSPSVDEKIRSSMEEGGIVKKAALATQHISYCHSHGVLGLADINEILDLEEHLQEVKAKGSIIDIRTSETDFLRIVYSSVPDNGEAPGSKLINQADLLSMLRRRGGKKAVMVANGQQQVKEALAAGCDAIEQGYSMGEDNLRKMAEKDILWIPSLLMAKNGLDAASSGGDVMCRFSMRYVAPGKADPDAKAFWKKMLTEQLAQLRLARKLGVKTAVGTGAGSIGILHGESVVEEMKLFIKGGYSLEQAIQCASGNGAGFFGMENLGLLAVGKKATFLVARGTVVQLPRKLAWLENIYVNGKLSKNS
jgi:imidazolonepropionase-like amidohydrolase